MKRAWIVVLLLSGCGTGTLESTREVGTAVDGLIDSTKKLQEALRVTEKQRDDFLAQIEEDTQTIRTQNKLIKQLNASLEQSTESLKESIGQTKQLLSLQRGWPDGEIHLKNGEHHEIDCTKDPCVGY